jgi:hypothetical protein
MYLRRVSQGACACVFGWARRSRVPEMDGVRIITNNTCEFLQIVPDCMVDVYQAGSVEKAAMLFDAYARTISCRV